MLHRSTLQKSLLLALRIVVAWLFLRAGLRQVFSETWTAANLMGNAQNLKFFFDFMMQQPLLGITDTVIPLVHLLLGVTFLFGVFLKPSAVVGATLMVFYYIPVAQFGWIAPPAITNEHIVYALIMLYLASVDAGRYWGVQGSIDKLEWVNRTPWLHRLLS